MGLICLICSLNLKYISLLCVKSTGLPAGLGTCENNSVLALACGMLSLYLPMSEASWQLHCVYLRRKGPTAPAGRTLPRSQSPTPNTEHTQPLAAPSAISSTSSGLLWSLWKSTGEEISAGSWDFLRDRIEFLLCGHGPVLPFLGKTCGLSDLGLEGTGTVSGLG